LLLIAASFSFALARVAASIYVMAVSRSLIVTGESHPFPGFPSAGVDSWRVRAVRLSYRPVTMQSRRFVTEIWSTDNPKIQLVSVSWRSVDEQARQDDAYSAFVTALHRKLAASGSVAQFTTGLPAVSYWFGVVIFVAVLISMAAMIVKTLKLGQWSVSAIIAAIFAVFALQIGNYFRRNRPSRYRPDAIPREVLPKI